jgi:uncharacterized protein
VYADAADENGSHALAARWCRGGTWAARVLLGDQGRLEDDYTTAEFPSWEATPASDWNYGLALDPNQPARGIEFTRRQDRADEELNPWVNPPTMLTFLARKIEDWVLQANPENAAQKFTPPLADLSASKVSHQTERLTLVPYGSTELRVTIFPAVKA